MKYLLLMFPAILLSACGADDTAAKTTQASTAGASSRMNCGSVSSCSANCDKLYPTNCIGSGVEITSACLWNMTNNQTCKEGPAQ